MALFVFSPKSREQDDDPEGDDTTKLWNVRNYTKRRMINPLNAELNPICYLLSLLGADHFLHVSRIRVKSLTLRLLMSCVYIYIYIYIYIYMCVYRAPILDVSRSHNDAAQSVGLLWTSDQLVAETST